MLRNFFIPSLRASGFVQQSRNSLSIRALSSVGEAAPAVGDKCEGVTKWFNYRKGYGFITMNSGSEDVFVHHMNLHCEGFRSLQQGEPVEFTMAVNEKGQNYAQDVTGPGGAFVQGNPEAEEWIKRVREEQNYNQNDHGGGRY